MLECKTLAFVCVSLLLNQLQLRADQKNNL